MVDISTIFLSPHIIDFQRIWSWELLLFPHIIDFSKKMIRNIMFFDFKDFANTFYNLLSKIEKKKEKSMFLFCNLKEAKIRNVFATVIVFLVKNFKNQNLTAKKYFVLFFMGLKFQCYTNWELANYEKKISILEFKIVVPIYIFSKLHQIFREIK